MVGYHLSEFVIVILCFHERGRINFRPLIYFKQLAPFQFIFLRLMFLKPDNPANLILIYASPPPKAIGTGGTKPLSAIFIFPF